MGATMELQELRYFQAVARSKSMTAAAKSLRVSQPTLTVAIRRLEERFSTKLFLRERSGVRLTSTGEALLSHAANIFASMEAAAQDVTRLESDDVGAFVIGCHESLGAYFLPDFMAGFLKQAPRVTLSLWNGTSADVEEAVVDRRVHFGLVVNARPHPDLVILPLFHDAVDFFVSARHAAATADLLSAHRLIQEGPLVYAGRVFQCQELLERLAASSLFPSKTLTCGDLELVKSLALGGIGVALLPRRVAAYGQEGRLRRLHPGLPFFPDTIALVSRADAHRTRAYVRLKDALLLYGRKLEGESEDTARPRRRSSAPGD